MDFVDQTFTGRVLLDGNTYRRCTFRNSVLVHEGGPFQILDGFSVDGTVDFDLAGGEATVKLLDMLGKATNRIVIGGRVYIADDSISPNESFPIDQ